MLWREKCTKDLLVDIDWVDDDSSLQSLVKDRICEVRGKGTPIKYIWILNETHKFNNKSMDMLSYLVGEMRRLGRCEMHTNTDIYALDKELYKDVLFKLSDKEVEDTISKLDL